jgi:peroxiredoxin
MMRNDLSSIVWAVVMGILFAGTALGQANGDAKPDDKQTESAPAASQPAGQLIEGLVINHLGGGIAGARVRVEALKSKPDDPPLAEGETNRTGEISIHLREPVKTPVRVRIQMDGYEDFVQEVDPTDPDNPPFVDASLEGASSITGVVRAKSTGKPVPGAKVTCESGGRELVAEADGNGKYKVKGVVRGSARMKAAADGFATARMKFEIDSEQFEQDVDLLAERPVELLVVTNEGDPAGKVMVEGWIESNRSYVESMTDDAGRATLRGIGEEIEEIRLRLNGDRYVRMAGFDERIEVPSSQPSTDTMPATSQPASSQPAQLRIVVNIAAKVHGKIEDGTGEPVVGVRVTAGQKLRADMPVTWTNQEGTYELNGLPAGLVTLTFQHPDHAPEVREIQLKAAETGKMDLKLTNGAPIGGKVVTSGDEPIDQAWVSLEEWKGYQTVGMRAVTDKDGKFTFPHAPEGEMTFTIVKAGFGGPVRQTMTAGKTDYRVVLEQNATATEGGGGQGPGKVKIPVGQTISDFTLTGVDGKKYKLSELKGKYVFLDFWASWCPPCQQEMPNIKALYEAMKNRADFVLLGISLDTENKDFKEFVSAKKIDWPQVWGPESGGEETFEMLDGQGIPYTCLIGPDGRLIAQHIFGSKTVEQVKKLLKE